VASISFDKTSGWWSVRYVAAPGVRLKKTLCKHPGAWSPARPPRKPPPEVRKLAEPYERAERDVKHGRPAAGLAPVPLGDHMAGYLASYARTRRPCSAVNLGYAWEGFRVFLEARKVTTLQGVTPALCAAWMEARLAAGMKPSTVRTERAFLSAAWAKARRERLVAENPWEFAPPPPPGPEQPPKHWSEAELVRLIGALDGWLRDWVVLDANTGLRVSALLGLTWADVDLPGNRLTVPPHLSKGGRAYSVRRGESGGARGSPVFLNPATGKPYGRGTVAQRIAVALRKAGVRDFGSRCHAIRHSFAVALVNADVSVRVIQALLGHSSVRTTEIYMKVSADKAQAVMRGFNIAPPADEDGA
jgi:integrase